MSEYMSTGDWVSDAVAKAAGIQPASVPKETAKFTVVGGVCKPQDFSTLYKFQELQRQLNRVAQMKGYTKIAVDGDIGPGTVGLARMVTQTQTLTAQTIASQVSLYTKVISALATSLQAPAMVSGPKPVTPPAIVSPSGQTVTPPPGASTGIGASIYDALGGLGTAGKVAAVGLAGGIVYMLVTKRKRRRK